MGFIDRLFGGKLAEKIRVAHQAALAKEAAKQAAAEQRARDMQRVVPKLPSTFRADLLDAANMLLDDGQAIRRIDIDRLAGSRELARLASEATLPCMPDRARLAALTERLRKMEPDADDVAERAVFVDDAMMALGAGAVLSTRRSGALSPDVLWFWALLVTLDERLQGPVTAPVLPAVNSPEAQEAELKRLRSIIAVSGRRDDSKTVRRLASWASKLDQTTIKAISAELWRLAEHRAVQLLSFLPLLQTARADTSKGNHKEEVQCEN